MGDIPTHGLEDSILAKWKFFPNEFMDSMLSQAKFHQVIWWRSTNLVLNLYEEAKGMESHHNIELLEQILRPDMVAYSCNPNF
jgi:hypothetical protein